VNCGVKKSNGLIESLEDGANLAGNAVALHLLPLSLQASLGSKTPSE